MAEIATQLSQSPTSDMKTPFFSICIPVFNGQPFLAETINSVLNQTFDDFELIILDNASTDGTSEIVSRLRDERIKVYRNATTLEPWENWSKVVLFASGLWTKLLCADDILHPRCLASTYDEIESAPSTVLVSLRRNVVDEYGKLVVRTPTKITQARSLNFCETKKLILQRGANIFGEGLSVSWRTDLTKKVGLFSSDWNYAIDLDYWVRISSFGPILMSSENAGSFRISRSSWTASIGSRSLKEMWNFFVHHSAFSDCSSFQRYSAAIRSSIRSIARLLVLKLRT
jgi:glycosyltransferase involved in cell wall biosynthesis